MSETTKKRSLDKLFGTSQSVRKTAAEVDGQSGADAADTSREVAAAKPRKRSSTVPSSAKRPTVNAPSKPVAKSPAASPSDASADAGPGGYLGKSRYRRGEGVLVKPSIYVRPDQAHALRMAAAAKDDPNGETMSEIIQALLDEHGYCDPRYRHR